jgi:hypothetical protein
MQDSWGSQVVKLEAIIPWKRAEEPVSWRAKSPLIEHNKEHHALFLRCREHRIQRHMASLELGRRHKLLLHEFLLVSWRNGGWSPILLCHGLRRKGRQQHQDPGIFFLFSFFFALSSFCPSFFFQA